MGRCRVVIGTGEVPGGWTMRAGLVDPRERWR